MIVRTIRISGWRCYLEEVDVGPFNDGLNIIHAPNATGKSTLFEALRRVLLDGHKVSGRDVETIRPWGRQLTPKVRVEFVHANEEYRVSKQYLDGASALLERKENGRYRRLAEGAGADEQTREILSKNPPGRGLCRLENWGIAQILWAPQGSLAIGPLTGDLVSDIRTTLSAQVAGTSTGPVEKRIEELYLQFFSAKGKLKTGKDAPALTRLQEDLIEARAGRQKAYDQYLAFEQASRRVEEFRARRAQARHDVEEFTKAVRDARAIAEAFRNLIEERDRRKEHVNTAEAQYKQIKQRIDLIKSTEAELAGARNSLVALEAELPLRDREVQERERETARRKAELEDARKGREAVDAASQLAESARRFNECSRELRRLDDVISKIKKAEKALADCRQKRNAHVAPDAKTLRAIRKVIRDRGDAQIKLEASLITLEIVPQKDGSVDVVSGETPGTIRLTAGMPTQVQGSPEVVAELPNVGRLRAWGPVGSVEEHRRDRQKAEQKLKELTEPYGTSDADALESLVDMATELDSNMAAAETKLNTLLSGQSLDELVKERSVLDATLKGFLDTHPEWEKTQPDVDVLDSQADDVKRTFVARVEACEQAWEKSQSALSAVSGQKETLSKRLEDARNRSVSLAAKLADLTSDGKSLADREAELQRVTMAWDAAKSRHAEILAQLEKYEDDPQATLERLDAQLDSANKASSQAREQEVREETRLENLSAEGTYSTLALCEERVAQLELDVKREESRVEAIRLLHDTVAACRSEAIAEVAKPVEVIATRTLQRIAGRRLGQIKIGEGFEPSAVVPDTLEQVVTLDNLSGGEQEQLYLATRLALAEVLGRQERQLVVLDDVLTATDTGRLAKVMNVLEDAAQRLQVLVLTCHPERYRGLKGSTFFDLENLMHEALQR